MHTLKDLSVFGEAILRLSVPRADDILRVVESILWKLADSARCCGLDSIFQSPPACGVARRVSSLSTGCVGGSGTKPSATEGLGWRGWSVGLAARGQGR